MHPRHAAVLASLLLAPALAAAQDAPLAGPTVENRKVPGVQEQYASGDLGRMASRQRPIPVPVFLNALRELPEQGLPLTPEQSGALRDELRLFGEELRAFVKAHADEVRELVGQLPREERGRAAGELQGLERMAALIERIQRDEAMGRTPRAERRARPDRPDRPDRPQGKPGEAGDEFHLSFRPMPGEDDTPPGDPMMMAEPPAPIRGAPDAEAQNAIARLRELRELAPSSSALQTRVWQVLTEAQREAVGASLDAFMAQRRAGAEEQRLERDIERRKAEAEKRRAEREQSDRPDRPGPGANGGPGMQRLLEQLDSGVIPDQLWERLPKRARQRVETLPKSEQAAALARFLRDRAARTGDR